MTCGYNTRNKKVKTSQESLDERGGDAMHTQLKPLLICYIFSHIISHIVN